MDKHQCQWACEFIWPFFSYAKDINLSNGGKGSELVALCEDYILSFFWKIGINVEDIGEGANEENDDGYTDDHWENEDEKDDEDA